MTRLSERDLIILPALLVLNDAHADVYRGRYIKQTDPTANFGDERYYGQDIIFHTERCNTFVIGMPYPWAEKRLGEGTPRQRELAFRAAKADLANDPDLSRALDVIRLSESDLFRGSIVPVLLAHRHASISIIPGGRVLDIASMIRSGVLTAQPHGPGDRSCASRSHKIR